MQGKKLHWIVDDMDFAEPKRKSAAEEAVDAHHHVHVEIPGFEKDLTKLSI